MTWTTFASLGVGPGTTPQLDANLTTLSNLVPIPCTAAGINALILTSTAGAAALSAYANYMQFTFIAAAANTGATTANVAGLGVLPIYADTLNGPAALVGGEIVQNCQVTLRYDSTLNGNSGGFHLQGGGGGPIGQTLSVTLLLAGAASVSGLFNGANQLLSGYGSVGGAFTVNSLLTVQTNASIAGLLSVGTVNAAAGNATLSAASVSGLFAGASIGLGGADALVRMNSTLATISWGTLTPAGGAVPRSVTIAGVQLTDNVLFGLPSLAVSSELDVMFNSFVSAAGTIVIAAYSPGFTATLNSVVCRVSYLGFAT